MLDLSTVVIKQHDSPHPDQADQADGPVFGKRSRSWTGTTCAVHSLAFPSATVRLRDKTSVYSAVSAKVVQPEGACTCFVFVLILRVIFRALCVPLGANSTSLVACCQVLVTYVDCFLV